MRPGRPEPENPDGAEERGARVKKRSGWTLNAILYGAWLFFVLGTAVYAEYYDAELHRLTGRLWMALAGAAVFSPMVLGRVRKWTPLRKRAFPMGVPGELLRLLPGRAGILLSRGKPGRV